MKWLMSAKTFPELGIKAEIEKYRFITDADDAAAIMHKRGLDELTCFHTIPRNENHPSGYIVPDRYIWLYWTRKKEKGKDDVAYLLYYEEVTLDFMLDKVNACKEAGYMAHYPGEEKPEKVYYGYRETPIVTERKEKPDGAPVVSEGEFKIPFALEAPIEGNFLKGIIKEKTDDREWPCSDPECKGEMVQQGFTQPNGQTYYECNECGRRESYP